MVFFSLLIYESRVHSSLAYPFLRVNDLVFSRWYTRMFQKSYGFRLKVKLVYLSYSNLKFVVRSVKTRNSLSKIIDIRSLLKNVRLLRQNCSARIDRKLITLPY